MDWVFFSSAEPLDSVDELRVELAGGIDWAIVDATVSIWNIAV